MKILGNVEYDVFRPNILFLFKGTLEAGGTVTLKTITTKGKKIPLALQLFRFMKFHEEGLYEPEISRSSLRFLYGDNSHKTRLVANYIS